MRFAHVTLTEQEQEIAEKILQQLLAHGRDFSISEIEDLKNSHTETKKLNSISNMKLLKAYEQLLEQKKIPETPWLKRKLRKRSVRTLSGIAPVTVLTKPFPCPGRCVYCPTEKANDEGKTLFELDTEKKYGKQNVPKKYKKPGALVMPKSYISSEPAAMRALLNNFDPWKQVTNRLQSLRDTGHEPEKCELIVLGGTFSFLPKRYQNWFVKRCLQAMNGDTTARKTRALVQKENETAQHRSIGIVLETRPDHMNPNEARRFRHMGATRVEMGVQTLNDEVSAYTKRGHGKAEVARATKILRDAGYKICHHMMPGLPGSTPEIDRESFHEMYNGQDYKPDYIKIYPCLVTPYSELAEWHKQGKFKPSTENDLIPLLMDIQTMTPQWVRITRLIRDIPRTAILHGSKTTNLRQHLEKLLQERGTPPQCIRSREIRGDHFDVSQVRLDRIDYWANDGQEIFLQYVTPENRLIALLRLRIPSWFFPDKNPGTPIFTSLRDCAFVRELHTYGELTPIGNAHGNSQHRGWGKKLLQEAERIAREEFHVPRMAVISGIGVKEYYRKRGYHDEATYMIKELKNPK